MAKQGYPESLNCWLRDYPRFIKVTFGPEMENLDGPWGNGSVVLLERIGFDAIDTSPVTDEVPPDIKVTYSNNGTDVDWIFKMGMYGWGSFFADTEQPNYYVDLEKFLEFESTSFSLKKFRSRTTVGTQILKSVEIPSVVVPKKVIYVPPIGETPPDPVIPPSITTYWDSLARTLVAYYSTMLNLNATYTVTATVNRTYNLNPLGRQVGPIASCANGQSVEYYFFDNKITMYFKSISYHCEEYTFGEGFVNCTYDFSVSDAYYFTTIYVDGWNRLPDLIRRI